MERDKHITPVIFRKTKERGYPVEITAVFPAEPGGDGTRLDQMTCYVYVGQHGTCDLGWYIQTKAAKPAEYAELLAELESIGYNLRVYRKMTRKHVAERRAEIKRLRDLV